MNDEREQNRTPDPERLEALRNLPPEVMKRLTKEEINAFLFEEEWPDSLSEKLRSYQVKE